LNPVPYLIALAIATNIGAAGTLIGNAQGIMIGEIAHLSFAKYLLWAATPVIVALGAACGIIWLMSRNHIHAALSIPAEHDPETFPFNRVHTIKGLVILALVVGLFFTSISKELVALAAAGIHLASPKFRTDDLLKFVDWPILVLFMGLFVVTGAFQSAGYTAHAAQWLAHSQFNLNAPVPLALATAGLSNLIGNSGTVMLLLKIIDLDHPATAYVLAVANSFGGNLLIIGSVANIIVIQQTRALGIKISFGDFARLGIPVTLAALAVLLLWVGLLSLMN
jgi:Na+/H+ antiporter NhaD/arsenite permease-like protein